MLTEVEARSGQGILTMPFSDFSDGIVVEEIEGLGPVKATLVSSSFAGLDGTQYHTARREDRNLKFQLSMEPNYEIGQTVEQIRRRIYGYFMPKRSVDFTFRDSDNNVFDISGRVESCDPSIFSPDTQVVVSVVCFGAGGSDFINPEPVSVPGFSVNDTTSFEIDYPGSVETGIHFTLFPDRDVSDFSIYINSSKLDFSAPLLAFDSLQIETTPGKKAVTQYRENVIIGTPVYGVTPQSAWVQLEPGINDVRIYAEGDPLQYLLTYYIRYGGL